MSTNPVTVTVCGHSLGCALAALLAWNLATEPGINVEVILFASPRLCDPTFAKQYNAKLDQSTTHYVNTSDIVPQLPLAVMLNLKTP